MKNTVQLSDKEQVNLFIQNLEKEQAEIVQRIREIILKTDKEIAEHIKWNSPSFYYSGTMKAFNPKEYKRDLIVLNLHKGRIMLVLPTGAKISDTTNLLEGKYTDGRRLINFKNLEDVESKAGKLQTIIKEWLKLIEK